MLSLKSTITVYLPGAHGLKAHSIYHIKCDIGHTHLKLKEKKNTQTTLASLSKKVARRKARIW